MPRVPAALSTPVRAALPWAAGTLALLLVSAGRYGYHRDELYFIALGAHPHLGAPDQPALVPLLAHAVHAVTGGSLVAFRVLPALAVAAVVVLTAVLARDLGAARREQALAAALMSVASITYATGHLFSTTTFDLLLWTLLSLLAVRHLREPTPRSWLLLGAVAGLALEVKFLVVFLLVALLVGVLLTARDVLATWWALAAAVVALALAAPYLLWQAMHGWPQLELAADIAAGGSGSSTDRAVFWPMQLAIMGPAAAAAWIPGLVRLARDPALRRFRAVAVAYVVLAAWFTLTGGKAYYLAGLYPVLIAAGVTPLVGWLARSRARLAAFAVLVTGTAVMSALLFLPWRPDAPPAWVVAVNYDAGETVGWPALARQVDLAADELGTDQVLAANYGEAGAVARYTRLDVASGHNGLWYLGAPDSPDLVAVGFDRVTIADWCRDVTLVGRVDNGVDLDNDEQGAPIWACRGFRADWDEVRSVG